MTQVVKIAKEGTTVVPVTMLAGRTICGRVTDAMTGAAIPGARIGAGWTLRRHVLTDAFGSYAFPGWTGEGFLDLCVTAEGYAREGLLVGQARRLDFELDPGDQATGRVLDIGGRPVAAAQVTAIASEVSGESQRADSRSSETGEDGAFVLTSLRRDMPHTLIVCARGHARLLLDFDPQPDGPGLVDLGDIVLPEGHRIEGVARDSDSSPIGDATVIQGRFEIATPQGEPVDLEVPGLRWHHLSLEETLYRGRLAGAVAPSTGVVIEAELLALDRSVMVEVLDPDGHPVPGVLVSAGSRAAHPCGRTDATGRITLERLSREPVSLNAHPPQGTDLWETTVCAKVIRIVPEGQLVTLHLRRARQLAGIVLDPDDHPLSGVRIEAREEESHQGHGGQTDAAGRFRVKVPHETVVSVEARAERDGKRLVGCVPQVPPDVEELTIRLVEVR
ncbi:MAG: carboxypeptidase-like regulatory domain-containing protein [Planctomycetota bacterium]